MLQSTHVLFLDHVVRGVWAFCVPKSVPARATWGTAALVSAVTVAAALGTARYQLGCSLQRAATAAGALFALTWAVNYLLNLLVAALLKMALS